MKQVKQKFDMLSPIDVDQLMAELRLSEEINFEDNFLTRALKDKIVLDVFVESLEHPEILTFRTKDELISFETEGDCCSHCWFADFFNVKSLIGQVILGTAEIDLEDSDYNLEDGRGTQESDVVYGFKIYTDRDISVLSFRDSSNGYYGGWMNPTDINTTNYSIKDCDHWISNF